MYLPKHNTLHGIFHKTAPTHPMLQPHGIVITRETLINNHEYVFWKWLIHYDRFDEVNLLQQQSLYERDACF